MQLRLAGTEKFSRFRDGWQVPRRLVGAEMVGRCRKSKQVQRRLSGTKQEARSHRYSYYRYNKGGGQVRLSGTKKEVGRFK